VIVSVRRFAHPRLPREAKFRHDFVAAWAKVMNLDRPARA
jgi:catalase (peroxidase I)